MTNTITGISSNLVRYVLCGTDAEFGNRSLTFKRSSRSIRRTPFFRSQSSTYQTKTFRSASFSTSTLVDKQVRFHPQTWMLSAEKLINSFSIERCIFQYRRMYEHRTMHFHELDVDFLKRVLESWSLETIALYIT